MEPILVFHGAMNCHNTWGATPKYRITALIPSNETYLWGSTVYDPPQHPYVLLHTSLEHASMYHDQLPSWGNCFIFGLPDLHGQLTPVRIYPIHGHIHTCMQPNQRLFDVNARAWVQVHGCEEEHTTMITWCHACAQVKWHDVTPCIAMITWCHTCAPVELRDARRSSSCEWQWSGCVQSCRGVHHDGFECAHPFAYVEFGGTPPGISSFAIRMRTKRVYALRKGVRETCFKARGAVIYVDQGAQTLFARAWGHVLALAGQYVPIGCLRRRHVEAYLHRYDPCMDSIWVCGGPIPPPDRPIRTGVSTTSTTYTSGRPPNTPPIGLYAPVGYAPGDMSMAYRQHRGEITSPLGGEVSPIWSPCTGKVHHRGHIRAGMSSMPATYTRARSLNTAFRQGVHPQTRHSSGGTPPNRHLPRLQSASRQGVHPLVGHVLWPQRAQSPGIWFERTRWASPPDPHQGS